MSLRFLAITLCGVLLIVGCGKKKTAVPPLVPVAGVVMKDGMPISGGSLQLAHQREDLPIAVAARIDSDGKFELTTLNTSETNAKPKPGAPAGIYRLTYHPESDDNINRPAEIDQHFTVDANGPNEWKVELLPK